MLTGSYSPEAERREEADLDHDVIAQRLRQDQVSRPPVWDAVTGHCGEQRDGV